MGAVCCSGKVDSITESNPESTQTTNGQAAKTSTEPQSVENCSNSLDENHLASNIDSTQIESPKNKVDFVSKKLNAENPDGIHMTPYLHSEQILNTQKPATVFSTPEKNFFHLQMLLMNRGTACLRRVWKDLWLRMYGIPWDDENSIHERYLGESCGKYCYSSVFSKKSKSESGIFGHREKICSGDTGEWDITLLGSAILSILKKDEEQKEKERRIGTKHRDDIVELVKFLKGKRNEVMHMGKPQICPTKFPRMWEEVRNKLVEHGETEVDCDSILSEPIERMNASRARYLLSLFEDHGYWIEEVTRKIYTDVHCVDLDVSRVGTHTPSGRYFRFPLTNTLISSDKDVDTGRIPAGKILLHSRDSENFLIIGPAGSGKTFTLKMLVCSLYESCGRIDDSPVPFYVTIASVARVWEDNPGISAQQILERMISQHTYRFDEDRTFALEMLSRKKIVLLADGLEQAGDSIREIIQIFFKLSESVDKIILTSRCAIVHNLHDAFILHTFLILSMEPLTRVQQESIAYKRVLQHNHKFAKVRGFTRPMITDYRQGQRNPRNLKSAVDFGPQNSNNCSLSQSLKDERHRNYQQFLRESEFFRDMMSNPALLSKLISLFLDEPDCLKNRPEVMLICLKFFTSRIKALAEMHMERGRTFKLKHGRFLQDYIQVIQSEKCSEFLCAAGYHLWKSGTSCLTGQIFNSEFKGKVFGSLSPEAAEECWRALVCVDYGVLEVSPSLVSDAPDRQEPGGNKVPKNMFIDFLASQYIADRVNKGRDQCLESLLSDPQKFEAPGRRRALTMLALQLDKQSFECVCFKLADRMGKHEGMACILQSFIFDRFQDEQETSYRFDLITEKQKLLSCTKQSGDIGQDSENPTRGFAVDIQTQTSFIQTRMDATDPPNHDQQRNFPASIAEQEKLRYAAREAERALKESVEREKLLARQLQTSQAEARSLKSEISSLESKVQKQKQPIRFSCSNCSKEFYADSYIDVKAAEHARNQHQRTCCQEDEDEETDEDEYGEYDCWTCGKCFSTRRGMFSHKNRNH